MYVIQGKTSLHVTLTGSIASQIEEATNILTGRTVHQGIDG